MIDTSDMSVSDGIEIIHSILNRKFKATYTMSYTEEFEFFQLTFTKPKKYKYFSNCCNVAINMDTTLCSKCKRNCGLDSDGNIHFYQEELLK